jgi:hypothetical protein
MIAQRWSDVSAANVTQPWGGVSCPLALAASAATRRPHDSPGVERCESLRQPQRGDPMIAQRWSDVSAANNRATLGRVSARESVEEFASHLSGGGETDVKPLNVASQANVGNHGMIWMKLATVQGASLRQPQRGDPMIAQRWSDVSAANNRATLGRCPPGNRSRKSRAT